MCPSEGRGDVLPLPQRPRPSGKAPPLGGNASRHRCGRAVNDLVDDACVSLNTLHDAKASRPLVWEAGSLPTSTPTSAQTTARCEFGRRIKALGPPPNDLREADALRSVMRTKTGYDVDTDTTHVPYDPALLNIVKAGTQAKKLEPLVTDHAKTFLDDPRGLILRSDEEVQELGSDAFSVPYTDPALKSVPAMLHLIKILHSLGLIVFSDTACAFAGLFTLMKKDGTQRLVIDARPANLLCREPPLTELAAPGSFGNMNIDNTTSGILDPIYFAAIDLVDSFYHFLLARTMCVFLHRHAR